MCAFLVHMCKCVFKMLERPEPVYKVNVDLSPLLCKGRYTYERVEKEKKVKSLEIESSSKTICTFA